MKQYFRQIPRESAGFKVAQSENFGLNNLQSATKRLVWQGGATETQ
jgi:hypothetical protein